MSRREIHDRTYQFALRIIKLCRYREEESSFGRSLGWQLLKSGTSIGANLEEVGAGQSRVDFISKCSISLKEALETRYWLRLLHDSQLIAQNRLMPLIQESTEIITVLTTIVKNAQKNA